MSAVARSHITDSFTHAANEDCINGGSCTRTKYIYAGNEAVAIYHRNSSGSTGVSYSLSDHEGSVASLNRGTDGSSIVNESYTPFGLRRNPTTWSGAAVNADLTTSAGVTRQGYTFQTALGLWMGMNHMNGRVEDAVTGRFLSADPHIPDRTNTQSYNRYSYVNNNPLTLVDPTGFDAKKCLSTGCPGKDPPLTGTMIPGYVPDGITCTGGCYTVVSSPNASSNPASGGSTGSTRSTGSTNASSLSGNFAAALNAFADQLTNSILGGLQGFVFPDNTGVSIDWLDSSWIYGPRNGAFEAVAAFNVPNNANGLLVQNITPGGSGGSTLMPYWEGFPVTNGVVSGYDVFRGNANYTISGQVQFYPGATMNDFPEMNQPGTPGAVPYSLNAPSTYSQPANWTPAGSIPHSITITGAPNAYTVVSAPPCNDFRCSP